MPELAAQHREAKGAPARLGRPPPWIRPWSARSSSVSRRKKRARPASARAVLAMLPGGDALEAAVAAGETPSPELVAAAGRVGDLAPVSGLRVPAGRAGRPRAGSPPGRSDRAPASGHAPPNPRVAGGAGPGHAHPPRPLQGDGRGVLVRGGRCVHQSPAPRPFAQPLAEATGDIVRSPSTSTTGKAHRRLVAANRDGVVRQGDPPSQVSGMAEVILDARGRLTSFSSVPPQLEASPGPWPPPDWSLLLREAGLDAGATAGGKSRSGRRPPTPTARPRGRAPPPGSRTSTCGVEAAAYHGRPVWFAVLRPWARPDRYGTEPAPPYRLPLSARQPSSSSLSPCPWEASCSRAETCAWAGATARVPSESPSSSSRHTASRAPFRADHVSSFGERGVGAHQGGGLPLLLGAPGVAALHGPRALCAATLAPHADLLEAAL